MLQIVWSRVIVMYISCMINQAGFLFDPFWPSKCSKDHTLTSRVLAEGPKVAGSAIFPKLNYSLLKQQTITVDVKFSANESVTLEIPFNAHSFPSKCIFHIDFQAVCEKKNNKKKLTTRSCTNVTNVLPNKAQFEVSCSLCWTTQ